MNLWFRLLHVVLAAFWRPKLDPVAEVSRLRFRVWPHDLDLSMHMNNGRYWTLMDLGRVDVMIRSGLWRGILKHRWVPVVSAGTIRFRRELRLFQTFTLETCIVAWNETSVVMEHRLVSNGRQSRPIVAASALARAGLYDRKAKAFVPVRHLFDEIGIDPAIPAPSPDVSAFLVAEEALKNRP